MCNDEREDLKTEEGDLDFPIVAIGASAGGLSAIEAFFSQMTSDSGMAFVVVQHLSPNHESMLGALIMRHTDMQTYDVVEGMIVEPNSVYIILPNCEMTIQNGRLCLSKRSLQGPQLPIDFFFRSLARDQCERAICIVLSGTGTDGMMGLKAIKSAGGMAMAQDPESAEHKNMPLSAISTGLVDYVQLPEEMPAQLFAYTQRTLNQSLLMEATALKKEKSSLQTILDILHVKTGNNFSYYKQNTIYRRIERRLAVNRIERLDHYVQYLEHSQQEVEALFREFLIGVTDFFRDNEAFVILKTESFLVFCQRKHLEIAYGYGFPDALLARRPIPSLYSFENILKKRNNILMFRYSPLILTVKQSNRHAAGNTLQILLLIYLKTV